jgi:hypothetical protein
MHRTLVALIAALLSFQATPPAKPTDPCSLLTPADVAPLLGSTKPPKSFGMDGPLFGCTWGGAGSGGRNNWALMITTPQESPKQASRDFTSAEKSALKHADRAQVEDSIGERAFSEITSYGARIVALKKGWVLQLQFTTGKAGTAEQLASLRAVARKAVAAL